MPALYKKKLHHLEKLIKEGEFDQAELLLQFCSRLCSPPFCASLEAADLWLELWPLLDRESKTALSLLPDPCLNHVESRLRKPERAVHLKQGMKKLALHDRDLMLESLRLYPHALCRTAESIGPLDEGMWEEIEAKLRGHRLWNVKDSLSDEEFWETAELLKDYRDLPQPMLDFLDLDRPREKAPMEDFRSSLKRFLIRERVEKIRHSTYELLRSHALAALR